MAIVQTSLLADERKMKSIIDLELLHMLCAKSLQLCQFFVTLRTVACQVLCP